MAVLTVVLSEVEAGDLPAGAPRQHMDGGCLPGPFDPDPEPAG